MDSNERRRVQRIRLLKPLAGRAGGKRIFVLDVSREGLLIAHQESLGRPGDRCMIEFDWDGRPIRVECELARSDVAHRVGKASYGRNIHHSGLTIRRISRASDEALRELIAWHVSRALDEQKANARGVPPLAAQSVQSGQGTSYVRHELVAGLWRETQTMDPAQPANGFTISDSQTDEEVAMLRAAYEAGDAAARTMIQKMANLSISRAEGIPTRRYDP